MSFTRWLTEARGALSSTALLLGLLRTAGAVIWVEGPKPSGGGGGGVGGGRKKDALAPGKALMRTNAAVISESCSGRDWSLHLLPALLRVADAQHPMGAGET